MSGDSATSLQCDLRQAHVPRASSDSSPVKGAWDWLRYFVKIQNLEPHPRDCNSIGLWWGLGVYDCHDRWLWSCESLSTLGPRRDLFRPGMSDHIQHMAWLSEKVTFSQPPSSSYPSWLFSSDSPLDGNYSLIALLGERRLHLFIYNSLPITRH